MKNEEPKSFTLYNKKQLDIFAGTVILMIKGTTAHKVGWLIEK